MKVPRHWNTSLLIALLPLVVLGCATAPASEPSSPSASVKLLSKAEIKDACGVSASVNPFLAPSGMIKGQPDEFVVLDIELALPSRMEVEVTASAETSEGKQVAYMKDATSLSEYWVIWEPMGSANTRQDKIENYCLPASNYTYSKGLRHYFVVLVGKNPLPRPSIAKVQVTIQGQEPKAFFIDLPPAEGIKAK